MPTYVSLLRGINVGGHKKILMAELRAVYTALGLDPVRTYIQSGNVVFGGGKGSAATLARTLEKAIKDAFGFDVPVVIRTAADMERVVAGNPFLAEGADPSTIHVTFLGSAPSASSAAAMASYTVGPDELRVIGLEAYLHCPEGMARTKLTPMFMERSLGVIGTTRNWRTVTTLLDMARAV